MVGGVGVFVWTTACYFDVKFIYVCFYLFSEEKSSTTAVTLYVVAGLIGVSLVAVGGIIIVCAPRRRRSANISLKGYNDVLSADRLTPNTLQEKEVCIE